MQAQRFEDSDSDNYRFYLNVTQYLHLNQVLKLDGESGNLAFYGHSAVLQGWTLSDQDVFHQD